MSRSLAGRFRHQTVGERAEVEGSNGTISRSDRDGLGAGGGDEAIDDADAVACAIGILVDHAGFVGGGDRHATTGVLPAIAKSEVS
jgi:hypothetical protein